MLKQLILFAVLACVAVAKTTNWAPQYALMAINAKWHILTLELLLEQNGLDKIMAQLKPVKSSIYEQIASGKGDLVTITNALIAFENKVEKENPTLGFTEALVSSVEQNKLDISSIATSSPEESWDFFYYSLRVAATSSKKDEIIKNLAAFNAEIEPLVHQVSDADIDNIANKVIAFQTDSDNIWPGYSSMATQIRTREFEKFSANLDLVLKGQPLPPTPAPVLAESGTGSASSSSTPGETTDAPSGSGSGNGTSAEPTPTTTAPTPATTAPSATSSAVSRVVAVGSAVLAAVATYLVL